MSEQKPDAATLANLADAASKLAALLTDNGGQWCEDIRWKMGQIRQAASIFSHPCRPRA